MATLEDPASARLGESLYMFLPRSVVGNLRDGWLAETRRLRSHRLPFFSPQNRQPCPPSLSIQAAYKPAFVSCTHVCLTRKCTPQASVHGNNAFRHSVQQQNYLLNPKACSRNIFIPHRIRNAEILNKFYSYASVQMRTCSTASMAP